MTNPRFIKSVIASAKAEPPKMPWTRGARRAAFIAKRTPAPASVKSA